ncbi:circumsporozoite protein-like [Sesbania bispinosa]|nr:circumsporozoite protein-like [Sesbania bispinosa]
MEPNRITLILHHRGSFVREMGELKYVGGEFCVWEGLDVDTVNLFTVETLCKEHYYRRFEKIFWLKPGRDLDLGLRELVKDVHVMEICNAGMENNGEVEIFFLHPVNLPFIIVDENSDSGVQAQKPADVTDHTTMASSESEVSPPVPQPMPSSENPHVAAPIESPLPTPIASPAPTLVPSPVPSPIPSIIPSPLPSPIPSHVHSEFSDDYENVEDSVYRPSHHVSDVDESNDQVPLSRKRVASSAERGKGVYVSASRKKANNNPQGGPDELDLSQGLHSANLPDSQPNNSQPTNVDNNSPELAPTTAQPTIVVTGATSVQPSMLSPTSNITSGQAASRPPSRGKNLRSPPYKPPGTVPGGLRQKLNTVRPPNVTHSAPPEATHHNSAPQQSQLQPSHETILAASQGTRARFMQFIPTPPGPSTSGPRPRGPPPPTHSTTRGPPVGKPIRILNAVPESSSPLKSFGSLAHNNQLPQHSSVAC